MQVKIKLKPVIATSISLTCLVLLAMCANGSQIQTPSPLGNKDIDKNETAIGDLVADAVKYSLQADIGIIAASELKSKDSPFAAGKITSDDISTLISYPDDSLTLISIDGKTIKQALERAVSIYPQPNLGFLQISGMQFSFDGKQTSGSRITSVTVGGMPLDDDKIYTTAMTNSMANGALGYWKIWPQNVMAKRFPDTTIEKAVDKYLDNNPDAKYTVQDRIAVK